MSVGAQLNKLQSSHVSGGYVDIKLLMKKSINI